VNYISAIKRIPDGEDEYICRTKDEYINNVCDEIAPYTYYSHPSLKNVNFPFAGKVGEYAF
jgi:hypothetical protein